MSVQLLFLIASALYAMAFIIWCIQRRYPSPIEELVSQSVVEKTPEYSSDGDEGAGLIPNIIAYMLGIPRQGLEVTYRINDREETIFVRQSNSLFFDIRNPMKLYQIEKNDGRKIVTPWLFDARYPMVLFLIRLGSWASLVTVFAFFI